VDPIKHKLTLSGWVANSVIDANLRGKVARSRTQRTQFHLIVAVKHVKLLCVRPTNGFGFDAEFECARRWFSGCAVRVTRIDASGCLGFTGAQQIV